MKTIKILRDSIQPGGMIPVAEYNATENGKFIARHGFTIPADTKTVGSLDIDVGIVTVSPLGWVRINVDTGCWYEYQTTIHTEAELEDVLASIDFEPDDVDCDEVEMDSLFQKCGWSPIEVL
jgi:hypothetical protein